MDVFLFGSEGMAGHVITDYIREKQNVTVFTSSRSEGNNPYHFELDVRDFPNVEKVLHSVKPDIIINCTGILNEFADQDPESATVVNGLFPHRLADWANHNDAKVIQLSTDCVFLGTRGNYVESDRRDGMSFYAKSKILGELQSNRHLTIRTSIVGPELKQNGIGLFSWFMRQHGKINGYKNVYWNGVTTLELAKAMIAMIEQDITGLYHLTASETISKYTLLTYFKTVFNKNDVIIEPSDTPKLDRTLKNTRTDLQHRVPSYLEMLQSLKEWMNRHAG